MDTDDGLEPKRVYHEYNWINDVSEILTNTFIVASLPTESSVLYIH